MPSFLDGSLFVMFCFVSFFGLTAILIPELQSVVKLCHHLQFLRSSTLAKLLIEKIR